MKNPTLDSLRAFVAVAEEGTFSAAGKQLQKAQSAISYAVAHVEEELGLELFDRSTRRPTLTRAGRALLADARNLLEGASELTRRASLLRDGRELELSVAFDVLFPFEPLVIALREFRERYPDTTLRLYSESLGRISELVRSGTCQIGLSAQVFDPEGALVVGGSTEVELVAVAAKNHPLARAEQPVSRDVIRMHTQIVLTDRGKSTEGRDLGVLSPRTWRVSDQGAKQNFIEAGFGWGRLPRHLVEDQLASGSLVAIATPEDPTGTQSVLLAWIHARESPPGPAGTWLMHRLQEKTRADSVTPEPTRARPPSPRS